MGISLTESRRRILLNTPHIATASGDVATFSTDMAAPLKRCVVTIVPTQAGSGDPSPSNVRTLTGRAKITLHRNGKNFYKSATDTAKTGGATYLRPLGTSNTGKYLWLNAGSYRVTFINPGDKTPTGLVGIYRSINGASAARIGENSYFTTTVSRTSTHTAKNTYFNFYLYGSTIQSGQTYYFQVERGTTYTGYEAYSGEDIVIDWENVAGTVYGAELDVLTGLLTVRPYYSSYAGETLVGPWISSMDVYAPGATPTTGAQVVDLGDIDGTYQLEPITTLRTLKGVNNVWHAYGTTEVQYWTH